MCRCPIDLLIPTQASMRHRDNPEVGNILGRLESYNRLYGDRSSGIIQRLRDLPFLLRRLAHDLMDPQRSEYVTLINWIPLAADVLTCYLPVKPHRLHSRRYSWHNRSYRRFYHIAHLLPSCGCHLSVRSSFLPWRQWRFIKFSLALTYENQEALCLMSRRMRRNQSCLL